MEALERARQAYLTPLERAYDLLERHVPAERWPDAELTAYCDEHCQDIEDLSDAELEALIEQA